MYYTIKSKDYDLYDLQAEMEIFCEKHVISAKVSDYTQLLSEEVIVMQKDFSNICLQLSYSEKDRSLELVCESSGEQLNPFENEDNEIGLKIIKAHCLSVDYIYANGKNIMTLKIKNEG